MKLHWLLVAQALAKKKTCPIPDDDIYVMVYGESVKDLPCGTTLCLTFMGNSFNVQAYKENAYCDSDLCTDIDTFLYYFSYGSDDSSSVIDWKIGSCDQPGSGIVSRLFPMGGKPPPVPTTQVQPQINGNGNDNGVLISPITRQHPGNSLKTVPGNPQATGADQIDFLTRPAVFAALMNGGPTPAPQSPSSPSAPTGLPLQPVANGDSSSPVQSGSIPNLTPSATNLTDSGNPQNTVASVAPTAVVPTPTKSNGQGKSLLILGNTNFAHYLTLLILSFIL
ncbi:hypothetical protein HK103_000741 [Boothiomyces macroporosus]|uniref:Uncharacterized protein n=1 Tax=Boothiomyces macroporosus TaxID=261099 RepID=A0AAD5UB74_9FUNG|nr:hypothetical protein HK103_000741 [Boothiomyces macroporosus]